MSFIGELKRRNVFRVGIAYTVIGWVLAQVAGFAAETFGAPDWVMKMFVVFLLLGLPLALFFAWAFELTPEGLKREKDIDRDQSITGQTGRKLDRVIIGVLVVALALFAADRFLLDKPTAPTAAATEGKRSIAVLPFANMSGNPDQDFFSDGITEEILNSLVRVEGLSVASRTSSFQFRDQSRGIPAIAEELQVLFVLEGSVRRSGDSIRITAQLIDAENDRHLWSETFDRQLTDIFAVQSEIANAITRSLEETLGLGELPEVPTRALTANMDAYDLYLKGQGLFLHRTVRQDLLDAVTYLEQAVELDPGFAAAWESLGAVYSIIPSWFIRDLPAQHYYDRAAAAIDKALELDPKLAFAAAVQSNLVAAQDGDLVEVVRLQEESIARDPRNPTTLHWYAQSLLFLGFFEQAADADRRCLELDPLYANCLRYLALTLAFMGDIEQSVTVSDRWLTATVDGELFTGTVDALRFIATGQRQAGILMLHLSSDLAGAPLSEWLRAIDNPGADHSAGLARFEAWQAESGADLFGYTDLFAAFGKYPDTVIADADEPWYWFSQFRDFRSSPEFKRMMESSGYLQYWRAKGFPPQCRTIGNDDFTCE